MIVPMDVEGAARGIRSLIEDEALQDKLRKNTSATDYSNMGEVERIYDLV